MIFKDASCEARLDFRRLDIHVRHALPNVHRQQTFCCRQHIAYLCCTVLNVSSIVGRRSQSSLVPPYEKIQQTVHFSTTPNTSC